MYTKKSTTIDSIYEFRALVRIGLLTIIVMLTLSACNSSDPPQPQATSETQAGSISTESVGEPTQVLAPDDPEVIQIMWEGSPHANSFVVSDTGENNSCSSCHSRYNYIPSIDDIPEECFTCKFEVDDPEPYIEEKYWMHVDCMNCHRMKKNQADPAISWLEFALIEEYSEVSSVTELCDKCHLAADVNEHFSIVVKGDHPNYQCTECHNAHDTTASCTASGCHEGTLTQDPLIPGHDSDHATVTCVACHDAEGLDIGFVEEAGIWTTLAAVGARGTETRTYTSHNIVLEAACNRCHFPGNPWNFSESVESQ